MTEICKHCNRKFGINVIKHHSTSCMQSHTRTIQPFNIHLHLIQGTTAKLHSINTGKPTNILDRTERDECPMIEIECFYDECVGDVPIARSVKPSPRTLFERAIERQKSMSIPTIPPTPRPKSATFPTESKNRQKNRHSMSECH